MKERYCAWALALAVLLLVPQIFCVCAAKGVPVKDSAVDSGGAAALIRFLEEDQGGIYTLSGDVVLDRYTSLTVSNAATVRMGGHSIRIADEGYFDLSGPVRFEGGGPNPLFTLQGRLDLVGAEVAASGNGATAVLIQMNGYLFAERAHISAEGENAVAIRDESELDTEIFGLERTRVTARGENAVGIIANKSLLYFFLCDIQSDGASVVSQTGEIVLDASRAVPMPSEAREIQRGIVPLNRMEQNGISVRQGTEMDELLGQFTDWCVLQLYDKEGYARLRVIGAEASWEGLPKSLEIPGVYHTTVRLRQPEDWVLGDFPGSFQVPIYVVKAGTPHLKEAFDYDDIILISFFEDIGDARAVLYYSVDHGPWRDTAELEEHMLFSNEAAVGPFEMNQTYSFYLDVLEGPFKGPSNTLEFRSILGYDGGGNQDGDDRVDQGVGLPPAQIILPVEPPLQSVRESVSGGSEGFRLLPRGGEGEGAKEAEKSSAGTVQAEDFRPQDQVRPEPVLPAGAMKPEPPDSNGDGEDAARLNFEGQASAASVPEGQGARADAGALPTAGKTSPSVPKALVFAGGAGALAAGGILWRRKRGRGR